MLTEDMKRMVREQRLAYVATVRPDGTPNLSPRGSMMVWDDDHLVYADLRSPGTTSNLRSNPAIEVNVVDPFVRKGYRFRGRAEVLEAGERHARAVTLLGTEVTDASRRIRAVILIRVDQARPVISPAYDSGVPESVLRERWIRYYQGILAGRPPDRSASD